jgi:hypothetical protein
LVPDSPFAISSKGRKPETHEFLGFRDFLPVRPAKPARIRFLFVESLFCSTLPSDPASRRRPCASRVLHLYQVAQGSFTPRTPDMPGTQDAKNAFGGARGPLASLTGAARSSKIPAAGCQSKSGIDRRLKSNIYK